MCSAISMEPTGKSTPWIAPIEAKIPAKTKLFVKIAKAKENNAANTVARVISVGLLTLRIILPMTRRVTVVAV